LHTPIELFAVDLNQKAGGVLFDCHIGTRQERRIVKPSALAILMSATALGYAAQAINLEECQGDARRNVEGYRHQ